MLYKIGDVSKILGISSDIMRYYEKKGIVKPIKGKDNDYRYYESWDVNFLIECLWFKEYGYTTKEIADLVSQRSYDDLYNSLKEKQTILQQKIAYQNLLLERLCQQTSLLDEKRSCIGVCEISESPDILRYLNRFNYVYQESEQLRHLTKKWKSVLPFTRRSFHIDLDVLEHKGNEFSWGFSLETKYAKQLGIDEEPLVTHLSPKKCIHYVFKEPGKDNFSPRLLQPILDFAKNNHLTITDAADGNLLCSVREDGVMTGYFEAWVPVSEQ